MTTVWKIGFHLIPEDSETFFKTKLKPIPASYPTIVQHSSTVTEGI